MAAPHTVAAVDPFDLPSWVGTSEITWTARSSIRGSHLVTGELAGSGQVTSCDLLSADHTFPQPALDDGWRRAAHQSWTYDQVLLVEYDGRLTIAVPGTGFTADLVLETLGRLAKAVGVSPAQFVAALRL